MPARDLLKAVSAFCSRRLADAEARTASVERDETALAEERYELERGELLRAGLLTALVTAGLLLLVFIVLDHTIFEHELAQLMMRMRLAFVATLVPLGWLARREAAVRRPHLTGLFVAMVMGAMIDVFVICTGGPTSPYYAGNIIVLLGVTVLFPWRPTWSLIVSLSLLGMYAFVAWPVIEGDVPPFVNAATFLASMGVVAVVSSSRSERLRRNEFENRRERDRMALAKDDFLASVSHDLRTPLNVVLGYSELLVDEEFGPINEAQRDTLRRIIGNARGQLSLVNDLLDLARIEQGKLALKIQPVRVVDLVPEISQMMEILLLDRDIEFVTEVEDDAVASGDAERIRQVLSNLLTNAAKFTECGRITLAAALRGECVVVEIRDTGRGMEESTLRSAFDPFWTGEHKGSGWGLGLSIVGKLLRVMDGQLEVESLPSRGTTVRIVLPAASAVRESQADLRLAAVVRSQSSAKLRITVDTLRVEGRPVSI